MAQASCAPRARTAHVSLPCVTSEPLHTVCRPTCRNRASAVDEIWFGGFGALAGASPFVPDDHIVVEISEASYAKSSIGPSRCSSGRVLVAFTFVLPHTDTVVGEIRWRPCKLHVIGPWP